MVTKWQKVSFYNIMSAKIQLFKIILFVFLLETSMIKVSISDDQFKKFMRQMRHTKLTHIFKCYDLKNYLRNVINQ